MIHILKLKMWLIFSTVLVCPILIPYFVHLTEETKGHSTLPTNFLQSALKTWKPSIFYPGINFSFQFRSQRLLQMFRVWRKGVFLCNKWTVQQETGNQKLEQNKSELNICIYESHDMEAIASVYQVIPMSAKSLCKYTANLLCFWNMNSSRKEYGLKKLFEKTFFLRVPYKRLLRKISSEAWEVKYDLWSKFIQNSTDIISDKTN